MSDDERPDSLAAQAAAWVPPWERAPRTPDRAYQAAAEETARAELEAASTEAEDLEAEATDETVAEIERAETDPVQREPAEAAAVEAAPSEAAAVDSPVAQAAGDSGPAFGAPGDGDSIDEAGLSDDDDDFDPAFEGPNPDREEPALGSPGDEAEGVDAAVDQPEQDPVDVSPGPELELPVSIEQAAGTMDESDRGTPVDAPLPPEGDDAGDVFDAAADDDVSDDGEVDLPFTEEVPEVGDEDSLEAAEENSPVTESLETLSEDPKAAASPGAASPAAAAASTTASKGEAGTAAAEGPESGSGDVAGAAVGGAATAATGKKAGRAGRGKKDGAAAAAPVSGGAAVPGQSRRAVRRDDVVEDATSRTSEIDLDLPGLTEDAELAGALEAIMLVVDEPVAELQLAQILEQPTERIALMLDDLSARYTAAGHGFDLRRVAGGWRLYTRPEYAAYVERFVLDGQSVRLTQAALETLAVVAYKQPVTRSRISAIRGVNCDGVMRTLVTRGLIEECGTEGETGAYLYRTTGLFLEKLGLNAVDQLPPLAPFLPDDVEEVLDATG